MWRATIAATLIFAPAIALADDKADCRDSIDQDLRIKKCSELIEHNPRDEIAYFSRGDAYELKGDIEHAISDYTKAIVLNPKYAPAYNSRGRAYVKKGDYVRAVDDVTRAGELTRRVPASPPVAKSPPAKQKEAVKPAVPAAGKSPVIEKTPAPGEAAVAEKPATAATAPVNEKPSGGILQSWPTWMTR
jgi:tetratricopeptide (TPR) repeat protein